MPVKLDEVWDHFKMMINNGNSYGVFVLKISGFLIKKNMRLFI